jgi:hypothetical protein
VRALLAGINRSPLPGMTLFIKPLSELKSELAMLTALPAPSPAPPRPGMGSGSSTRNGCWGVAAAIPAPSPMVAIAASATPMPAFTRVDGRRVVELANVFSDNGIPLKFS